MAYEEVAQDIAEMLELWSNNPHVYLGYDIGHGNPVSFKELAEKVLSHPRIAVLSEDQSWPEAILSSDVVEVKMGIDKLWPLSDFRRIEKEG